MKRPSGMLMTGAVGCAFNTVSWFIMIGVIYVIISMALGGSTSGEPGEGLGRSSMVAFGLLLIGSILQGVGFLGMGKVFSKLFTIAGLCSIGFSTGLILVVVGAASKVGGLVGFAVYMAIFCFMGTCVVAGLSFLKSKDEADSGQMMLMISGFCFLAAGGIIALLYILGLAEVDVGMTFGKIIGYLWVFSNIGGHICCFLAMLAQRKGDAPSLTAQAA
jgi:hypothetical protein